MVVMKRVLLVVVLTAVAAATAYVFGIEAGNYVVQSKRGNTRKASIRETQAVLQRMSTIEVGDTLPNYMVEDIDGNRFMLSELLCGLTVISFITPDCDACLIELGTTVKNCTDSLNQRHFVYISTGNPVRLRTLRSSYGIKSLILFDEAAYISGDLRVSTFPFNVIIDRHRCIQEVQSGGLWPEQYERVLNAT